MRIVIFANGVLEDPVAESRRWVEPGSLLVAADGGADHILAAGLTPDHVIGDMDSLAEPLLSHFEALGVSLHRSPVAKDETDLELALTWAAGQSEVQEIVVLGAFGGRPDQALANLLLLAIPELRGQRAWMVDGPWTVRLIRGGDRVTLVGSQGDRLSLIPLAGPAEGVTTEGLHFSLSQETLDFGPARGVSNRFQSDTVSIALRTGMLWCFHEQQLST